MRSEEEVNLKVRELYNKLLKERKDKYLLPSYMNCKWNTRHKVKENSVGFCHCEKILANTKRQFFICNDDDTALKCQLFSCKHTEESVQMEFDEILRNPARCGQEYPKLAVLIWVLQRNENEKSTRWIRLKKQILSFTSILHNIFGLEWW